MPAACRWIRRSRLARAGARSLVGSFGIRDVMAASTKTKVGTEGRPRAREGVIVKQFLKRGHASAPPMLSPQAPGTKLTAGHEAPLSHRSPRPVAPTSHHSDKRPPLLCTVPSRCLTAPPGGGLTPL